ncbi:hypothetical protein B0H10DRAFT_2242022 [Mycena sp. CBHHK59/15]|nr:hypothetical protein B0H10DRAFT_2242022 [Mycena sp. CBHHK59/15]
MFSKSAAKCPRTVSISSDGIEIISPPVDPQFPPSKRAKTHDPSPETSASVPSSSALDPAHGEAEFTAESELLEDLEVPPEQLEKDARSREGDAALQAFEHLRAVYLEPQMLEVLELNDGEVEHVGVYWDGHERKDVKKWRKEYLAELEDIEPFIPKYTEPDMAEILLELSDSEQEHVVIVHDEATIQSNDYQNNHYWLKPGEQVLKKKGRGRLIMISAFLCERYGLLDLTDEMVAEMKNLWVNFV